MRLRGRFVYLALDSAPILLPKAQTTRPTPELRTDRDVARQIDRVARFFGRIAPIIFQTTAQTRLLAEMIRPRLRRGGPPLPLRNVFQPTLAHDLLQLSPQAIRALLTDVVLVHGTTLPNAHLLVPLVFPEGEGVQILVRHEVVKHQGARVRRPRGVGRCRAVVRRRRRDSTSRIVPRLRHFLPPQQGVPRGEGPVLAAPFLHLGLFEESTIPLEGKRSRRSGR